MMDKYNLLIKIIEKNVEGTAIKVMAYLIDNADSNNEAHVSYKEMAEFVGRKDRNVYRYLKKFEKEGIITICKKGKFNYYKINEI